MIPDRKSLISKHKIDFFFNPQEKQIDKAEFEKYIIIPPHNQPPKTAPKKNQQTGVKPSKHQPQRPHRHRRQNRPTSYLYPVRERNQEHWRRHRRRRGGEGQKTSRQKHKHSEQTDTDAQHKDEMMVQRGGGSGGDDEGDCVG